jgi:Uma2 family endonuclease
MSIALRKPMTLTEILSWEERQEVRYEFDGLRPVAMAGGTAAHAAIQRNLLFSLTGRLRCKPCQPYGSDLKIEVAGRIRYPGAFVVCSPAPRSATVITNPVVNFDVLSDGTAHDDLVLKNAEYRQTPSVQRYVILQQTHPGAIVFARKGEDWVTELLSGDGAMMRMPEIGIEIPVAELYTDGDLGGSA